MQHEKKTRFAGRGYYIALAACIAAVGITGYVFVKTARSSAKETLATSAPVVTEQAVEKTPAAGPAATSGASKPSPAPSTAPSPAEKPEKAQEDRRPAMAEPVPEETLETVWPLEGTVTAVFSRDTLTFSPTMGDWRTHEALDIQAEAGTPVRAARAGDVTAVYEDDYLGQVVVVTHSGDLATLYGNLEAMPAVSVGDHVGAGQVLGTVGTTALLEAAEAAHLHFAVFENGQSADPMTFLSRQEP